MPATTPEDRLETAKDICAFANADGGLIVFGVAQANGGAGAIKPIKNENLDQAQRRILQIVESKIEPRLEGLQFHEIKVPDGMVLLLQIPKSYVGPHSHGDKAESRRFVIREGTLTMDLTFEQLRTAFDRTGSLKQRTGDFIADRLRKIPIGEGFNSIGSAGPSVVLHIVPGSSIAEQIQLDIATLASKQDAFTPNRWTVINSYPNLDGLIKQNHGGDSYMQLYRSGIVEIVERIGREHNGQRLIPAGMVVQFFRFNFGSFLKQLRGLGIAGPVVVSAALTNVTDFGFYLGIVEGRPKADRGSICVPPLWIDDIESITNADEFVKPMMDMMWQAFGQTKCIEYQPDGTWKFYNYEAI